MMMNIDPILPELYILFHDFIAPAAQVQMRRVQLHRLSIIERLMSETSNSAMSYAGPVSHARSWAADLQKIGRQSVEYSPKQIQKPWESVGRRMVGRDVTVSGCLETVRLRRETGKLGKCVLQGRF
jgi:hypothetical protein